MLDINFIRQNPDQVRKALIDKQLGETLNLDELLSADEDLRKITLELDQLRQNRNELDVKIKTCKDETERKTLIDQSTQLKPKVLELEKKHKELKEKFDKLILLVPNVTSPAMHVGKDDSENKPIRNWGEIPQFDFEPLDHVDIGKKLDIIDVEKSGLISGSRTYYLKGAAVMMQFAILHLVFSTLTNQEILKQLADKVGNPSSKPFIPMIPPPFIRPEVMKKMDRLDPIEERYEMKSDELVLVGSAEHTMGPYHMDEVIELEKLPLRYIGYSTAYRREAGSHGKDVRGILRAHHFDKAEMETYVQPEYGQVEQDLIVAIQEYLIQQLKVPYQVVQICTGDAGKPDYNQIDIECWIPSQKKYRETHTSDYMTDYQSRRLNIKYKKADGEKEYVYMNDATAFAVGRILIAILENYQQKDGSVIVPEVLRKYTGFDVIKAE